MYLCSVNPSSNQQISITAPEEENLVDLVENRNRLVVIRTVGVHNWENKRPISILYHRGYQLAVYMYMFGDMRVTQAQNPAKSHPPKPRRGIR